MTAASTRAGGGVRDARARDERCGRRLDLRADVPDLRRHHGAHGVRRPDRGRHRDGVAVARRLRVPAARARRAAGGRLMRVEMFLGRLGERRPALASDWQIFLLAVLGAAVLALDRARRVAGLRHARCATSEFAGVEGIFKITVWPIKFLIVVGFRRRGRRARASARSRKPRRSLASAADPRRALAPLGVVVLALLVAALWFGDVEPRTVGVAMIALGVVLIVLGMPIAFALLTDGLPRPRAHQARLHDRDPYARARGRRHDLRVRVRDACRCSC